MGGLCQNTKEYHKFVLSSRFCSSNTFTCMHNMNWYSSPFFFKKDNNLVLVFDAEPTEWGIHDIFTGGTIYIYIQGPS